MKKTFNIQLRYEIEHGEELEAFTYNGKRFYIICSSASSDLYDGFSPYHAKLQYIADDEDGNRYEVYVYYYTQHDAKRRYAVVDAIRDYWEEI